MKTFETGSEIGYTCLIVLETIAGEMADFEPNDAWRIPSVQLVDMRLPNGRRHVLVSGQEGHIKSYLSRFGVVPATYKGRRILVRPDADGEWQILEVEQRPDLMKSAVQIEDAKQARGVLVSCEWQLVGYTVNRTLIRLLFDESGEGYWSIATWGFRDISPALTSGYFEYTAELGSIAVTWPEGSKTLIGFRIYDELNICSGTAGLLSFFDYSLSVEHHVVPAHICDLQGWPLTYWGTVRGNEEI